MWKYAKLVTIHRAVVSCIPLDVLCFIAQSHLTVRDPHGLQPTRLLCPWDSPGKNTGVGCHVLLQDSTRYSASFHWTQFFVFLCPRMAAMLRAFSGSPIALLTQAALTTGLYPYLCDVCD